MGYKLLDPQPGVREPYVAGAPGDQPTGLAWDERGPGLYPNERAFVLASGAFVAVSVEPTRLENNAGVVLWGNARWIERDGTTRLDGAGKHVETDHRHTVGADLLAAHPLDTFSRELLLLMLGELPALPDDEEAEPETVLLWSDQARAEASIALEIASARQSMKAPDPAALLGLALEGRAEDVS